MANGRKPWYLRPTTRWTALRSVPLSRLWPLLCAGFLLFSVIGFYTDLMDNGVVPYAVVLLIAIYSGLNACVWIYSTSRLPVTVIAALALLQFFNGRILTTLSNWMELRFALRGVPSEKGVHFAAVSIIVAVIGSYVFFLRYIIGEGKRSIRLQNELELAHAIQQSLVPTIHLRTVHFEVYGISHPSERVGGDLVDAVSLPSHDVVAYLADIAGHGLPASILMGRLKTAARTALLDCDAGDPQGMLPVLLQRLNIVLPQVKEPNLYATFTGFRLGSDGTLGFALAASPPILFWSAREQTVTQIGEPQLPIGLLPVASFDGFQLPYGPGDLLVVATDGILEVANKGAEEFGVERLKAIIAANAGAALPEVAEKLLSAARQFGNQFDDQTMLLVRCL